MEEIYKKSIKQLQTGIQVVKKPKEVQRRAEAPGI